MKARITAFLLFTFLASQGSLKGAAAGSSQQPASPQHSLAMRFYLSRVIVQLRDGSSLYGLLVKIEGDSLILRKAAREEKIPSQEIKEVILEIGKNPGPFLFKGMLAGMYLGDIVGGLNDHQPFAYFSRGTTSVWEHVYTGAAGIGISYLASLFEKGNKSFSFSDRESIRLAEWERMRDFASGKQLPKRVHLSIQAGEVSSTLSKRYRKLLKNAGYTVETGLYSDSTYARIVKDFNLLRKCQLSYSIRPWVDVGAAVVFLGEPTLAGREYEFDYFYGGYEHRSVSIKPFPSTGFFAVSSFKPFASLLPRPVQLAFGLGLGTTQINFDMSLHHSEAAWPYSERRESYSINKTVFSSLFFTELNFFLYDYLSLGIIADYVFLPPEEIPAFPAWDLPSQKIRLGNGCLGISLVSHF